MDKRLRVEIQRKGNCSLRDKKALRMGSYCLIY